MDENEAPKGTKAKIATMLCGGCCFIKKDCLLNKDIKCTPGERKDKALVIFIKQ